ncbi:PilZ domain-containing protein [Candidatus Electrothrix sp.]|uniref:PilZ domain-containing protein n=1 Tax=Candidatus Electrothrix sp. TaxID=2170559 RepID=UPI0040571C08
MKAKNRRRFSRLNIQWAVRLDFGAVEYKRFIHNISLGGLYIEGEFQQVLNGDVCTVNLKQSGFFTEEAIRAVGAISRVDEQGMAVEFLSMKLDSFFFLQTALYYKAIDPMLLGKEFIDNNIFEVEGDLIFFQADNVHVQTIKQMRNYLSRLK